MSDTTHRYFQSAKVAPAVARGVQKVMEVTIETPIDVLMGNMGIGRDPDGNIYASMKAIFDPGWNEDGSLETKRMDDREWYGPYNPIFELPRDTQLPVKLVHAIIEATDQFIAKDGVIKGFHVADGTCRGTWKRRGPEIVVFNNLSTINNPYHGVTADMAVEYLVYSYPGVDAGKMPTQWTTQGATNLGTWNDGFPGYEGFPNYWGKLGLTGGYPADIVNLSADLACAPSLLLVEMHRKYYWLTFPHGPSLHRCWSMVAAKQTIAKFAGYELAE